MAFDGRLVLYRVTGPLAPNWVPPTFDVVLPGTSHLCWVMPGNIDGQSRTFSLPTVDSLSYRSLIGTDRKDMARLVDAFLTGLTQIRSLPIDGDRVEPTPLQRLRQWWTTDALGEPEAKLRERVVELLTLDDFDRIQRLFESKHNTSVLGSASCSELFPADNSSNVHVLIDEVCAGPSDWEIGVLLGEQIEILAHIAPTVPPTEDPVVITLLKNSTTSWNHLGLIAGLRWLLHLHDYLTYVRYSESILEQATYACSLITNQD